MNETREAIRAGLLALPEVVESPGIFDEGMAFWVNGKQAANFLGDDMIAIRLTRPLIREMRERLRADPRVAALRASSDWIQVGLSSNEDVAFVLELAEMAFALYRPPPGVPARPPPLGAELERRRRFH
jgi:hypothetical protein